MSLPPFIDAVHAAELLRVNQETILDWVKEGKLQALGGKATNPFLRRVQVEELVRTLGVDQSEPVRRTKSPTARVQTRLTADARWAEVAASDIQEWVKRADSTRRQGARAAAILARQRLEVLLEELDRAETG